MLSEDIKNKIYAGWLGKLIGIRSGAPIEMWSSEQIKEKYGKIDGYLKSYSVFPADDDSNVPTLWLNTMYNHSDVKNIKDTDFANSLLNLVAFERGMFWWGGYGVSQEHTAYLNLLNGLMPPLSGSEQMNGKLMSEQIGGQIFIDIFGQVYPGEPTKAALLAKKVASITHDGNAVYGGMFIAAAVSAAFIKKSVFEILEIALSVIPNNSNYYLMADDIIRFYNDDKQKDYEKCLDYVKLNYWKDKFGGNCHIIPNAAIVILALLYGQENFSSAINISNSCGFDTDCNSANVGCIMGTLLGTCGIDYDKWRKPINDIFVCSSVLGSYNIVDVPTLARKTAEVAIRLKQDSPYNFVNDNEFIFDFAGSTCGFYPNSEKIKLENSQNKTLKICGVGRVSRKTYFKADEFESDNYSPCFSPIVYPGQTINFRLKAKGSVKVKIFALNSNANETLESKDFIVSENETEISYKIEDGDGVLISEIGLSLLDEGSIEIIKISFSGEPKYVWNFEKEKIEFFQLTHNEVSQSTHNKGFWRLENNSLVGSCAEEGAIFSGHIGFKNCSFTAAIKPILGENHLLLFNVLGLDNYFAFGFFGKNRVALLQKDKKTKALSFNKFIWKLNEEYIFKVETKNNKIVACIDDEIIFNFDNNTGINAGQFGFKIENNSKVNIRYFKIN